MQRYVFRIRQLQRSWRRFRWRFKALIKHCYETMWVKIERRDRSVDGLLLALVELRLRNMCCASRFFHLSSLLKLLAALRFALVLKP